MFIVCRCGHRIHDSTDYLPYKGHIISDRDFFDFLEMAENAIKSGEKDKEKLIDEIYDFAFMGKVIYQCSECGSLYIQDEKGNLNFFSAEAKSSKNLMKSVYGGKWKGFLEGCWYDKKPDWYNCHGMIFLDTDDEKYNSMFFDDFEEFEKAYYSIFEELKSKNIIRSASLKVNNKKVHQWNK